MKDGRNSGRVLRFGMALLTSSLLAGATTAAVVVGSSSPAAAAGTCTFNGQASVVTGVTPGGTPIAVSCTGLPSKLSVLMVETSALSGLVSNTDQSSEADTTNGALQPATATKAGTLTANFNVPNPFTDADSNGVCPPTQAQVNAGEVGCLLTVATIQGASYGTATLQYAGQPTPQAPTLALSPSSAGIGQQVTISDGAGPGDWWGNAGSVTPVTSADISIGGVQPADTSASISAASYGYKNPAGPFTAPRLSGSFVVPCGVTGSPSVSVTEANTTGIAGTVSASAPLTVIGGGTNPAITSVNPTQGSPTGNTTVTITGCNFTGVTSVDFGTTPAVSYTIDSSTQITAVAPPGIGSVAIELTGPGGKSPISIATQFSYGAQGYTLAGSDGGVFNFGSSFEGSLPGSHITPAKPVVGMASTSDSKGYWLAGADGGVFGFGDAVFHGSLAGQKLAQPIVGIAATPDGGGYWLVGADGGVFGFGDAVFHGSLAGLKLAKPIVGIAAAPDGKGYWLVGADGGVFGFGSAGFHGSLGGVTLAKPVVGITPTTDGGGYWLAGADGGVFGFGNAGFHGSEVGHTLSKPVVGIVSPDSAGYELIGADGGIYTFGDASFSGSAFGKLQAAVVGGTSG